MASATPQSVCFFGATGGCANAALVLALNAGHPCTALARTPSKLTDMLLANGVSQATIDRLLRIQQGNAKDVAAVKATLSLGEPDMILSGIGALITDKNPDMTICRTTTRNVLAVLHELQPAKKPHYVLISTTGLSETNDVPCLMHPLYHWLLAKPHEDKKAMEGMVEEEEKEMNAVISGWTFVRPALLTSRKTAKSVDRIEVGMEENPAVGYTIPRRNVGLWIFENLINGNASAWKNKKPSMYAH